MALSPHHPCRLRRNAFSTSPKEYGADPANHFFARIGFDRCCIEHRIDRVKRKKKGDLPGRFVSAHLRKHPNEPGEYVNVSEYQERVDPIPSPVEAVRPQGELELVTTGRKEEDEEE